MNRLFRRFHAKRCRRPSCAHCYSATKRHLYDLAHALEVFGNLDIARMVEMSGLYFDLSGQTISRAPAHERMFAKLANPHFLLDVRPLLPATQAEALTEEAVAESFRRVLTILIDRLSRRALGEDAGHEGRLRNFMVTRTRPTVLFRSSRS